MQEQKRILVVEDNRDNMTLILDLLQSLQYASIVASNGEEALELIDKEKPALILLDLSLPKLDGWTAAQKIKANQDLADIPIIALTAHAMLGDKERALAAGCDDYVSKPINFRELASKLAQYLP
ncbi:MAG: response regulator [Anaerolineae bacterium]|nr:response regulator [Anaerolineae bacterium]MCA9907114.1 response regulator [Anaerolineae bacterium]